MQGKSDSIGSINFYQRITPLDVIKREMESHNWTIQDLAEKLNVKPQTLYNITGNSPRRISTKLASALSEFLGETLDFWLSDYVDRDYKLRKFSGSSAYTSLIDDREKALKMASNQVGILNDETLEYLLGQRNGPIAITPFDNFLVKSASIDLRLGQIISKGFTSLLRTDWVKIATYENDKTLLDVEDQIDVELLREDYAKDITLVDELTLEHDQSVFVVTLEHLRIGLEFVARVGATATNALMGLNVGYGFQVDPGYQGPLVLRVHNQSGGKIDLERDMVLVSLEVARLPNPARNRHSIGDIEPIRYAINSYRMAVLDCFSNNYGPDGKRVSVSLKGARDLFVKESDETFDSVATNWFINGLRDSGDPDHQIIVLEMQSAMRRVAMSADSVLAWGASLRLHPTQMSDLRSLFADASSVKLSDVVEKIGRKPRMVAIELLREAMK